MTVGDMVIRAHLSTINPCVGFGLITNIDGRYCWVFWPRLASDMFDGFKWCELKDLEVICEAR